MSRNRISMKVFSSWWFQRLLIGLLALVIITLVCLYFIPKSALSQFINCHIESATEFLPSEFGLTAIDFTVDTSDGIKLTGEEFRINDEDDVKGIIIMTSGLHNPVPRSLYGHAKLFTENGYSVIVYNSRAHQSSSGNLVGNGITETNDIDAVVDYVRSYTIYLNKPIILMGWNTGAASSLNAAAENKHISGVVSIGSYDNTYDYFLKLMQDDAKVPEFFMKLGTPFLSLYLKITYGFDCLDVSPDLSIAKISCPVLLVHSTGDSFISYESSDKLASLSENSELWIREAESAYITDYFINLDMDEEYSSRIMSFIDAVTEEPLPEEVG